jgi:hypothetical protein
LTAVERSGSSGLAPLTVFATAFGFIEGAVVVYLRQISYPGGFHLPLVAIPHPLLVIEVMREAATLFVLLGVAWLASSEPRRRMAAFAFCFGIWDLVYYLTLAITLGWPASLLDWDVLFLIPAVWMGPVLAPVLIALGLVLGAVPLLRVPTARQPLIRRRDWAIEILAGLLVVSSFLWAGAEAGAHGPPGRFAWWLYGLGFALGILWFLRRWRDRERPSPQRM